MNFAKEAQTHLDVAEKSLKTSLFKWKPDFDTASDAFDRAGLNFKLAKDFPKAIYAYTQAAKAHEVNNALYNAAKAYENVASILKDLKKDEEALDNFERAALMLRKNGQGEPAAQAFEKASQTAEAAGLFDKAVEFLLQTVDIRCDDGRPMEARKPLSKAVQILVRCREYEKALRQLENLASLMFDTGSSNGFSQAILCRIILYLKLDDQVGASRTFQEAAAKSPAFLRTDDAVIGNELLDAYEQRDDTAVSAIVKNQTFTFLDNEFALLARGLSVTGSGSGVTLQSKPLTSSSTTTSPSKSALIEPKSKGSDANLAARNELFGLPKKATPTQEPAKPVSVPEPVPVPAIAHHKVVTRQESEEVEMPPSPARTDSLSAHDEEAPERLDTTDSVVADHNSEKHEEEAAVPEEDPLATSTDLC